MSPEEVEKCTKASESTAERNFPATDATEDTAQEKCCRFLQWLRRMCADRYAHPYIDSAIVSPRSGRDDSVHKRAGHGRILTGVLLSKFDLELTGEKLLTPTGRDLLARFETGTATEREIFGQPDWPGVEYVMMSTKCT